MTALGEALEAMCAVEDRVRSLRMDSREVRRPVGDLMETVHTRGTIWHRAPDLWRAEWDSTDGHALEATDGRTMTRFTPQDGWTRWGPEHPRGFTIGPGKLLLEPLRLLDPLLFERADRVVTLDRPAVRLHAVKRPPLPGGHRHRRPTLPFSDASTYDLVVDLETGILLRFAGLVDGEPIEAIEATEVSVNTDIDRATFQLDVPEGEPVRTLHVEKMSVQQAAAMAPFTLLMPPTWCTAAWFPHGVDGRGPPAVHLFPQSPFGRLPGIISIHEQSEPFEPTDEAWETVERDGRVFDIGQRTIRFTQEGTFIEVQFLGDPREALDTMLPFEPPPTDPPTLVDVQH